MTDPSDAWCLQTYARPRTAAPLVAPPAVPPRASAATFHTVTAVAELLGVSRRTIDRRIREGLIRTVPMGGRLVRISSDELERLAAGTALPRPGGADEVSMACKALGQ
jgi:excisionase family DNA binding protein